MLRDLKEKDAPLMLEWMHDKNVCSYLGKDFAHMTLEHCRSFIRDAQSDERNRHFAIVDAADEYMGTISLKNIDYENLRAEYAVSCRTKAMGKGFARRATQDVLEYARKELGLKLIYLDVYDYNIRAQKMYQRMGFIRTDKPAFLEEDMDDRLLWFEYRL